MYSSSLRDKFWKDVDVKSWHSSYRDVHSFTFFLLSELYRER